MGDADKRAVFAEIHPRASARRLAAVRRHRQRPPGAPRRRCGTPTCGPVESPSRCRVRAGTRSSKPLGSSIARSVNWSTRSPVPVAGTTPVPTRCTGTRSDPSAHRDRHGRGHTSRRPRDVSTHSHD
jgi:hypothetical protein